MFELADPRGARRLRLFGVVLAVSMSSPPSGVARAQYPAVVSVRPSTAGSAIAVELTVPAGTALSSVRWLHNDGEQVFPRVALVEGEPATPPDLSQPGLVLQEASAVSLSWGRWDLSTPVSSSTGTVLAVFFFPESVPTQALGTGGGPGLGVRENPQGENAPFYLSADGLAWSRFDAGYELGVQGEAVALKGRAPTLAEVGGPIGRPSADPRTEEPTPEPEATEVTLSSPWPNPFNPRVAVRFTLPRAMGVELRVYDLRGRLVRTLLEETRAAGSHTVVWEGDGQGGGRVSSGTYFVRLRAGAQERTERMVVLR